MEVAGRKVPSPVILGHSDNIIRLYIMCCKVCWFLEMRGFGVLLNAKVSLLLAKSLQIPRKKKRSSIWHDLDNHEHYKSSIVIVPLETMFHRT